MPVAQNHRGLIVWAVAIILVIIAATGANADPGGTHPGAGLVSGKDGAFYGTTQHGGDFAEGTVFKVSPSGTLTTLHSFSGPDGAIPNSCLVQGADGAFYGTTMTGGTVGETQGYGTIYRITASGMLTTLYRFTGADGRGPQGLAPGTDGVLYGTASGDAATCWGTVFRVTTGGAWSVLHTFKGADGQTPLACLVQGADGSFYGTTWAGGQAGYGTIFKITPGGKFTSPHSFHGLTVGRKQSRQDP